MIEKGGAIRRENYSVNLTDTFVRMGVKDILKFAEAITNDFSSFQSVVYGASLGIAFGFGFGDEIIEKVSLFLKCVLANFLECSLTLTKLELGSAKGRAIMWITVHVFSNLNKSSVEMVLRRMSDSHSFQ